MSKRRSELRPLLRRYWPLRFLWLMSVFSIGPDKIEMVTVNGSGWTAVREFLQSDEAKGKAVVMAQEVRLIDQHDIDTAVEWCDVRGWKAVISKGRLSDKGTPMGGCAVVVADGLNIGVTPIAGWEQSDRLVAVGLEIPGVRDLAVASTYFQVGSGLGQVNVEILGHIAQLQIVSGRPTIVGGDFNNSPGVIEGSDFLRRAGMKVVAPATSTCITRRSQTKIDYFLISDCLEEAVREVSTLKNYPLAPHRPVRLITNLGRDEEIEVVRLFQKMPTKLPVGPLQQRREWHATKGALLGLEMIMKEPWSSRGQRQAALDRTYKVLAQDMEDTISRIMDFPLREKGKRAQPPKVIKKKVSKRELDKPKSWVSSSKAIRWLQNRITEFALAVSQENWEELEELLEAVEEDHPQECSTQ